MIRRTTTGYSVDVPDLPGCVATGASIEQSRQMIAEAIEMHLDLLRRSGQPVGQPSTRIEFSISDDDGEELCTWVEVEEARRLATA
jgi:predicted RNase H-like HicB family nuclease